MHNRCRASHRLFFAPCFLSLLFHFAFILLTQVTCADAHDHEALDRANLLQGRLPTKLQTKFQHDLKLRQVFHRGTGSRLQIHRRLDITAESFTDQSLRYAIGPFGFQSSPIRIDRFTRYGRLSSDTFTQNEAAFEAPFFFSDHEWKSEEVEGPDVTDKSTVINLARMSNDAYKPDPSDPNWTELGKAFNSTLDFGWEDDGLQGHVFADENNSTIVIAIKGTSRAVYDGSGTTTNDKENDNLFGSCCCGQGGAYLWRQVCDCMTSTYNCNSTCVKSSLKQPNRYYQASLELYSNITEIYPNSSVIFTGHSLGGVLASLLGLTFSHPAVTFEAYPQALAANRLDLPVSPAAYYGSGAPVRKNTGAFHFGHTADPVYMGACNSASSFCSIAGYAFETLCHTGMRCVYDVVGDWKWKPSVRYHSITYAIENVYTKYNHAAPCVPEDENCVDCYPWNFFDSNGTDPTKSGTTSSAASTDFTRTRTATCETPGWWGCRDKTTTSGPTTTSSTNPSTGSTATCTHYGWFGRCLDPTSTATAHNSVSTAPVGSASRLRTQHPMMPTA